VKIERLSRRRFCTPKSTDPARLRADAAMQHKSMPAMTGTNILADIDRRRSILRTYTSPGIEAKN
jgi:hypothetical protein